MEPDASSRGRRRASSEPFLELFLELPLFAEVEMAGWLNWGWPFLARVADGVRAMAGAGARAREGAIERFPVASAAG